MISEIIGAIDFENGPMPPENKSSPSSIWFLMEAFSVCFWMAVGKRAGEAEERRERSDAGGATRRAEVLDGSKLQLGDGMAECERNLRKRWGRRGWLAEWRGALVALVAAACIVRAAGDCWNVAVNLQDLCGDAVGNEVVIDYDLPMTYRTTRRLLWHGGGAEADDVNPKPHPPPPHL